ncbi:unnamed protein product, partial [Allacma fusca]
KLQCHSAAAYYETCPCVCVHDMCKGLVNKLEFKSTHENAQRAHPCGECQMKFSSPSNLIRHRNECCNGSFNSASF